MTPQDIIVNISIEYDFKEKFINYADIVQSIKHQMKNDKFFLIEDALESLSKNLRKKFPLINELKIKITKPSILPDCTVSVSSFYKFQS